MGPKETQRRPKWTGEDLPLFEPKWARVKDELCELGLTPIEIDVYALLERQGSRKAIEVSRALNIPKTEAYLALADLKKKGVVTEISKHPAKFEALPFEEAFRLLILRGRADVKAVEEWVPSLLGLWSSLPPRGIESTPPIQFQKLLGLHRVCHRVREMVQNTRNELVIMASEPELAQLETYGLFEEINALVENGVHVTILAEPAFSTPAVGLNVVTCSSIQGRLPYIILMDREELLAITDEKDGAIAIWTNCPSLCAAIHLFFTYEYAH